ncbi:MAG: GDSL-type esterase/lipase family protein, partial [Bacteroidota bacterium]|nr:GDSL-type esterase/lipase family protein [Bacteroidota bacterium]
MLQKSWIYGILFYLIITSCTQKPMDVFPAYYPRLLWQGRYFKDNDGNKLLVGSGSGLRFRVHKNFCRVWMQNIAPQGEYNYISLVIDGEHQQRIPIAFDTITPLKIAFKSDAEFHNVEIYKETESSCGSILITSVEGEGIGEFPYSKGKNIEFIGNSITAGMSSDLSMVPCEAGKWYDQHNAYNAYGPSVARALNLNYMITAVSGMGVYRNWNTDSPVMGDVYESTFLTSAPNDPRWNFNSWRADIITICLGTNDLSDGDGMTPRLPFNSTQFIARYVSLLKMIHQHHPDANFILLQCTSREVEKMKVLQKCHAQIKEKAISEITGFKSIELFTFSPLSLD